jgi:hypothetical protein
MLIVNYNLYIFTFYVHILKWWTFIVCFMYLKKDNFKITVYLLTNNEQARHYIVKIWHIIYILCTMYFYRALYCTFVFWYYWKLNKCKYNEMQIKIIGI